METHPEQVKVMMADINNNYQLLQSLAKKVEQVEGRGQPKVVNIPESLCILLAGKSYHWCIKMLSNGWSHTNIQKRQTAVKGPSVNTTAKQGHIPQSAVVLSETAKRNTTMRKKRKVRNTVFQVSLPISKGSVLLKRTSFSRQVSLACSPLSDADLSPESLWTEDCELDCDTGSFAVTHAEQTSQLHLYNGDGGLGQYMGPEKDLSVSHYQAVEGYYSDNEYNQFNQSEYVTPWFHGERNYNRECDSQERLNTRFEEEGQWQGEGPQTQNEWLSPAGSHPWHWSSCNASYRPEVGYPEQWYYSTSQSQVGTGFNVSGEKRQKEMSSEAVQYSHQQHPQDQYMSRDYASLTGSMGQSGELAPHLDATRINTHPHVGDPFAHSGNIAPQSRVQLSETEYRDWQEYMNFTTGHVQTAQQNDVMQPTAHQAIQVVYGVMSNTNDNTGSTENPDQYFPSVFWR
ncbi:hypothetical protein D5F01_LYC19436 [Larimichthys crocea]|uniref:Uncharacterized protein n=1 Tax=Larimichthys crocea TaxID=215358 RepID=A0A6G0HS69_LARCR|nr:hypothetical protein D5F01_LYC19436 [Larimichthys crocea]